MSIVGVDRRATVTGIRHFDLGLIDDIEKMAADNDRIKQSIKSGKPDVGLIVAHYEFFSDPSLTSDLLGGDVGQHVGDPTYRRQPSSGRSSRD